MRFIISLAVIVSSGASGRPTLVICNCNHFFAVISPLYTTTLHCNMYILFVITNLQDELTSIYSIYLSF